MEHGYLILSLLVLLFLSMYGYSYIPVIFENRREARLKIEQTLLEETRMKEKLMKQQLRDERLNKSLQRSAEIRRELQRIEEMRAYRREGLEEAMQRMKIESMKKQQAS